MRASACAFAGLLLCAALSAGAAPAGDDPLLEPEKAFRFSARLLSDDMLEVSYRIAEGYYLYKERFSFSIEPGAVKPGAAVFPPAQWHEDEFFGRSEIYRQEVKIRIPLESRAAGQPFRLLAVSQGCADVGVCYLPTTHRARLAAPGLPRPK
jgi:thiol:disulfide interchange protein DsbD